MPGTSVKKIALQLVVFALFALVLHWVSRNVIANLERLQIASGFDFLNMRAGISIPDSLISYNEDSSYGRALLSGLVNTVFISVLCIIMASLMGLVIAFGRLSHNWILQKLCLAYVEIFRNLPPLLVILLWYFGVLQQVLPPVRESFVLPFHIHLNQRGIYFPALHWQHGWDSAVIAFFAGLVSVIVVIFIIRKTGNLPDKWRDSLQFRILFIPAFLVVLWFFGHYGRFEFPQPQAFNVSGGASISPEFLALFLSLSFYTAALVSETIRAGVEGVDGGIKEAAASLGLHSGQIARFIILPLALRIIIPPLASQYMNLVKNTSLAVAIGYSELMRVSNTVLNQTNQSIEVVVIWMTAYLGISLIISALMNWFNHRTALVGY